MSQAAPILRDIKGIFNSQGINNDVQIASYLGFLLLARERWEEIQRASQYDFKRILTEARYALDEKARTAFVIQSNLP